MPFSVGRVLGPHPTHPTTTHPTTPLHQDNNWGLVQQVLAAKQRRSVSVLTRTFLTLPLTSIASAAGLQNAAVAEQYVLRYACGDFVVCRGTWGGLYWGGGVVRAVDPNNTDSQQHQLPTPTIPDNINLCAGWWPMGS